MLGLRDGRCCYSRCAAVSSIVGAQTSDFFICSALNLAKALQDVKIYKVQFGSASGSQHAHSQPHAPSFNATSSDSVV